MQLLDILCAIYGLGVYEEKEWEEYLGCFEDSPALHGLIKGYRPAHGNELAARIYNGKASLQSEPDRKASPKILTLEELACERVRKEMTLGILSGAFDLLHLGHVQSWRYASEYLHGFRGAALCVLLLSDRHIQRKKGGTRPVLNINERLALVTAVQFIDYAVPLEEPDCLMAIERLGPDFFFKSKADLTQDIVRREIGLVEELGGQICYFPVPTSIINSTTDLINTAGLMEYMGMVSSS